MAATALEALGLDVTADDKAIRRGITAVERGIESAEQAFSEVGDLRTAYTTVAAEEKALTTLRESLAGLKADVDRWQAAVAEAASGALVDDECAQSGPVPSRTRKKRRRKYSRLSAAQLDLPHVRDGGVDVDDGVGDEAL